MTGKKVTKDEFIERSHVIHKNAYDYSKFIFVNTHSKGIIICPAHGEFLQDPHVHLKSGCPKCAGNVKWSIEEFTIKARKIHGDKYDYSKFKYRRITDKGIIICKIHGEFLQNAKMHVAAQHGCAICGGALLAGKDHFIKNHAELHNYRYNYDKLIYKNYSTNVIVTCPIHNDFYTLPWNYSGCPRCNHEQTQSKGEKFVERFLIEHSIKYKPQKSFNTCRNIGLLRFDFYLKDLNILLEYDGIQHFKFREKLYKKGRWKSFARTIYNDRIKNRWAKDNNKLLVRIRYDLSRREIVQLLSSLLL